MKFMFRKNERKKNETITITRGTKTMNHNFEHIRDDIECIWI